MTVNRSTLPSGEVPLRDVRRLIRRAEAEAVQLQRRERGRRAPGSATAAPFTVRRRTLGGGLNRAYAEMVRRDAPLAQARRARHVIEEHGPGGCDQLTGLAGLAVYRPQAGRGRRQARLGREALAPGPQELRCARLPAALSTASVDNCGRW